MCSPKTFRTQNTLPFYIQNSGAICCTGSGEYTQIITCLRAAPHISHGTALSIQGFYGRKLCFYILENLSVSVADIECTGNTVDLKYAEG